VRQWFSPATPDSSEAAAVRSVTVLYALILRLSSSMSFSAAVAFAEMNRVKFPRILPLVFRILVALFCDFPSFLPLALSVALMKPEWLPLKAVACRWIEVKGKLCCLI
jgi:hypothetical protein